jgi:hypothetical protein
MRISECPVPNYSTSVDGVRFGRNIYWWPYADKVFTKQKSSCPTYLGVAYLLRHYATSRKVSGSIPGGVTGDFFRGIRQLHVPGVDSAF